MKKTLFILLLLVSSNVFAAAQKDTVINIDSLPPNGVGHLVVKGWKFHTGDDPAFASPDYNDSRWQIIKPTVRRPLLPKAAQRGMGWLRMHFKLAPSLHQKILLQAFTSCAVEIYVDGKLAGNRGTIDPILKTGRGYTNASPMTLPLTSDSVHLIAVRYAHQANIQFMNGYLRDPFLSLYLTDAQGVLNWAVIFENYHVLLAICMSVLFLLTLLHIVLLYHNPVNKANLYLGCYVLLSVVFTCILFLTIYRHIYEETYVYANLLWPAAVIGAQLSAIKALYILFHFRQGKFYTLLMLIAIAGILTYAFAEVPAYFVALPIVLGMAMQLWLAIKAVYLKKRGALIIASGFLGGLAGTVVSACTGIYGDINNGGEHFMLIITIATGVGVLSPTLGMSMFLFREFALDGVLLQQKLGQVKTLSAQTIAQEQEKQQILANQNIILEQQVTERTAELQEAVEELENKRKAVEGKNRELEIETALERVRARTAAMQKSTELRDVAQVIFEQLLNLGFDKLSHVGFLMDFRQTNDLENWLADAYRQYPFKIYIPYGDYPVFNNLIDARDRGLDFCTLSLNRAEKNDFLDHVFANSPQLQDESNVSAEMKTAMYDAPGLFMSRALMKNVVLFVQNYTGVPHTEAEMAIIKRFAAVFEQSYTRFKDLEQAEAQVREAQIEAALEKVRSRSLAMHKADELQEVVNIVFEKWREIGMDPDAMAISIPDFTTRSQQIWLAVNGVPYDKPINLPYHDHPIVSDGWNALVNGADYFSKAYTADEKNEFFNWAFENSDFKYMAVERKAFVLQCEAYAASMIIGKVSLMLVTSYSGKVLDQPEAEILKRFGRVFEQAYIRFLDLQKAEAQAREAIKQASVDRVRGEIASMRTTADLQRITPVIWSELTTLEVPFIRSGVFIVDEDAGLIHTYLSTPDGRALASFSLPFDSDSGLGIAKNVFPAWQKKQIATLHWSREEFAASTETLIINGLISKKDRMVTEHPDTTLDLHFFPFLQGMLYVGNPTPLNADEMDLAQSLAEAFSTAYARYEDFSRLEAAKQQVDKTLTDLKAAQTQLIQTEKMASLGELTAGIAHEIQNPLNFVNNFSEVSIELLTELKEEEEKGNRDDVMAIADDLSQNLEKIRHHGKRADAIVKGMLQHSRATSDVKEPTDINKLADEYLRLAYHGLRAKDKNFNAELVTRFAEKLPKPSVVPQDIGRVLLNVINNAFYAVQQKSKTAGADYKPAVEVNTRQLNGSIMISVKDNGNGIPEAIKDKIMQPFFTTKPTGEGTGLGLSLSYDIVVKGHGGAIEVDTQENEYTEFIIELPVQ